MPNHLSPQHTFVVRFWQDDPTGKTATWRGSAEHLQSKQSLNFLDPAVLLPFFERYLSTRRRADHEDQNIE